MLLVTGLSTRMLVKSLAPHHEVFALDVFGDLDTLAMAVGWRNIGNSNKSIEEKKFLKIFEEVVREFSPSAWIHTSGFEGKYKLISKAEKVLFHYGLSERKIKKIRTPVNFFNALNKLGVNYPETIIGRHDINLQKGWLRKDFDTAGGRGISKKNNIECKSKSVYLQKEISGRPLSVSFFVGPKGILVFGYCENIFSSTDNFPYLYQGVIGPVEMSSKTNDHIFEIIKNISIEFELVGLNGLDFILINENVYVLEINPRSTGAMEIFESYYCCSLLEMHCNAFSSPFEIDRYKNIKFFENKRLKNFFLGSKIVYAEKGMELTTDFAKQAKLLPFCRDIPNNVFFKIGDPVCSIIIESFDIKTVNTLLLKANFIVKNLLDKTKKILN